MLSNKAMEKNAMAMLPAMGGCISCAYAGATSGARRLRSCCQALGADCLAVLSASLVAARILWSRCAGGSASANPCRNWYPAKASAKRGRQRSHVSEWLLKACILRPESGPLSWPSTASVKRASNSAQGIPFCRFWLIATPAYIYVVEGAQVPCALGLYETSPCPREPLKPGQSRGSRGLAGRAE